MKHKSSGRVAALAAAALVGGLVPFVAATSASAATPTGITVSPGAQTVPSGGTATITATITGPSASATTGVYFRVTAGPDAPTIPSNAGTACPVVTGSTTTFTCTVPAAANTAPGTDTVQVFFDAANAGGFYQGGDPAATASVTFAGPATRTTVTPASAHRATDSTAAYTINGYDVNGAAASGSVTVSISETVPNGTADPLLFTAPGSTTFPAAATGTTTPGTPVVGATTTTYTDTQPFSFTGGAVTIGVASSAAGTVSISAGANSTTFSAGTASLTVTAGNTTAGPSTANDNNAVGLTMAANPSGFAGQPVSDQVTITNAAGDPLGGVTVVGRVTAGPNAGATVTSSGTTNQLGQTTLSYTSSATAGTDTLQAWVNQSTHTVNTAGPDAGEPQASTTVTLTAEPAGLVLTSNKDGVNTVPTSQPSNAVTYTLTGTAGAAAGLTLNFSIDASSTPGGKGYTVTPASAVTNASGQVTVTVNDPSPLVGDHIKVDAVLQGDASKNDNNVVFDYAAAAAATMTIAPTKQTVGAGATVTETATVTDNFQAPVSGQVVTWAVIGRNGPATNTHSTGSCTTASNGSCSFSYTDAGPAFASSTSSAQTDTVTATDGALTQSATVYFVPNPTTAHLTLNASTTTTGTNADPAAGSSAPVVTITSTPTDSNGNTLYNKTVTFTSTGVGGFTDSTGHPIGNSTTANVDGSGVATVYVRSAATGTETITASADGVASSPSAVTITYTNDYVGMTPQRVLDTRTGQGALSTVSGAPAPVRIAPNTNYVFYLSSTNLPAGQAAYAFNVTAIGPNQAGNLRIAPVTATTTAGFFGTQTTCTAATPTTSLVNYQVGKDIANFVVVPNSACNEFVIYSEASSVSVAIDAVGYYPDATKITAGTPSRVVDTRTGLGGVNGPVTAGTSRSFQLFPAATSTNPKAVALNVTAIDPSGLGNLRVYPDGAAVPNASNINYIPGVDKAAFVIVNVPADGKIDVYSDGATVNVAIDQFATYPTASNLVTATPVRILDTRNGTALAANTPRSFQVTGLGGVPTNAQAVLISVTSIHTMGSTGVGNLRVYPAGGSVPVVSTLNYVSPTADVANFAMVRLGTNGQLTLYSDGSPINVAVDVVGYIPAG